MLHVKDSNGQQVFMTPLVTKGKGKDTVNVTVKSGALALNIAYMTLCGIETSAKDNRYDNKTNRKASLEVLSSLGKLGKPEDLFVLYSPKKYEDRDSYDNLDKWTPVYEVTRGELVRIASEVVKVDKILADAESKTMAIALQVNPSIQKVGETPRYFEGQSAGRGKRKSGTIEI